jgi:hypothetical protein
MPLMILRRSLLVANFSVVRQLMLELLIENGRRGRCARSPNVSGNDRSKTLVLTAALPTMGMSRGRTYRSQYISAVMITITM